MTTELKANKKQTTPSGIALCLSFVLLILLFHLNGNSLLLNELGASLFVMLYQSWTSNNFGSVDSSHGPLIIFCSLFLMWRMRKELIQVEKRVFTPAILLLLFGLLLHWIGLKAEQSLASQLSLIVLIWTIPLFIYGPALGKLLIFPCSYLLFAIPWNILDGISLKLRLFAASASELLLNGIAIPVTRNGTGLFIGATDPVGLDVADPCSGLHSLTALCAFTVLYAYFLPATLPRKAFLAFTAIPIAIISNIVRIVALSIMAFTMETDKNLGVFHDASGYIVFIPAIILTITAGRIVNDFKFRSFCPKAKDNGA